MLNAVLVERRPLRASVSRETRAVERRPRRKITAAEAAAAPRSSARMVERRAFRPPRVSREPRRAEATPLHKAAERVRPPTAVLVERRPLRAPGSREIPAAEAAAAP